MKIDKERAMFAIASLIFMIFVFVFAYGDKSKISAILDVLVSAAYVAYAMVYFVNYKGKKVRHVSAFFALFVASVLITAVFDTTYIHAQVMQIILNIIESIITSGLMILPTILLVFLARSAKMQKVKKEHRNWMTAFACILYFAAIAIPVIFILSGLVNLPALHLDDEEFITLNAANYFVRGINPYTMNFSSILASNISKMVRGRTYTANGTVVGSLSYPALSFLIFVPFALINNTGAYHFTYGGFYVIYALFAFIVIVTTAYMLKKEHIERPPAGAIVALLFAFAGFASINDFLMLALVMIALYKMDSRHLWIVLGILASLQEETWIVILLILIYVLRNYGTKKALYDLLGTVMIFILINGYFIILSPSSFAKGMLGTVNGELRPQSYSAFGYLILKMYPLLKESIVFFAAIIVALATFYIVNVKELIPLFGLLPLMFLFNGIPAYYLFFIPVMVISMYVDYKNIGAASAWPRIFSNRSKGRK